MDEPRSKLPYLVFGASLVLGLVAGGLLWFRPKPSAPPPAPTATAPAVPEAPKKTPLPALDKPLPPEDPASTVNDLGIGAGAVDPAALVARIGKALEAGDLDAVMKLIGKEALDPAKEAELKRLAAGRNVKLRQPAVREVGELELGNLVRWALELDGAEAGRDRIFLDLRRKDGKWGVEKLTLPPATGETAPRALLVDSLGIADAFLQATLKQDFELAKEFADPATVSDATIAGLCILFEEGQYRMRKQNPLRTLVKRPDSVGYLANVETSDGLQGAQFSLLMKQPSAEKPWRVAEINLDQLLADYAKRFAGGDSYYSPLVKNPRGGDTLVLYFEFDEDHLGERTRRQLDIVARILSADAGKKLTLSGHTDALGGEDYNSRLSLRRADVVRDYLVSIGVDKKQIITVAKGMTQPRRPNFTESGEDNPEGRKVNRRTEIYLDF